MKVKVKLYGTWGQRFPGYQHSQGLEVEIPDGATAKDLLAHLAISESQGAVLITEGRVLKANDTMQCGAQVNVLQSIQGG
jgi:sulfur carrier protein ThiS